MKKVIVIFLYCFNFIHTNYSQCTWNQLISDDFEYSTPCPDLIPGMVVHDSPQNFSPHSGNSALYMNIIDGQIGLIYDRTLDNLCPNVNYQISFWTKDAWDWDQFINLDFNVLDSNNQLVASQNFTVSGSAWNQGIIQFTTTSSLYKFQIVTNLAGTGGNDPILDDFKLERCDFNSISLPSQTICSNTANLQLLSLVENASTLSNQGNWSGPSNLSNNNLGTFNPAMNSSGTYTYTITHGANCPDSIASISINVNQLPLLEITDPSPICQPNVIDLTNPSVTIGSNGGTGFTFWQDNLATIPLNLPQNIQASGVFYIKSEGFTNCFVIEVVNVIINPLPEVSFTINPIQICEPGIYALENTSNSNISDSVNWVLSGGILTSNQTQTTVSNLSAGTYNVTLEIINQNGCKNSLIYTDTLVVLPIPKASFQIFPSTLSIFNTHGILYNFSTNATNYTWTGLKDFEFHSSETNPSIDFPEGIIETYSILLIASSSIGCSDTTVLEIKIEPDFIFYAPNSFTPNGDENNQVWNVSLDGVYIRDYHAIVFDRWGEIIWESFDPNFGWDGTYNNTMVEAGIYVWTVIVSPFENAEKRSFKGFVNLIN